MTEIYNVSQKEKDDLVYQIGLCVEKVVDKIDDIIEFNDAYYEKHKDYGESRFVGVDYRNLLINAVERYKRLTAKETIDSIEQSPVAHPQINFTYIDHTPGG